MKKNDGMWIFVRIIFILLFAILVYIFCIDETVENWRKGGVTFEKSVRGGSR